MKYQWLVTTGNLNDTNELIMTNTRAQARAMAKNLNQAGKLKFYVVKFECKAHLPYGELYKVTKSK